MADDTSLHDGGMRRSEERSATSRRKYTKCHDLTAEYLRVAVNIGRVTFLKTNWGRELSAGVFLISISKLGLQKTSSSKSSKLALLS